MALSKEAYRALEDIVGPDNISDDPALLDSYIYPMNATSVHLGPFYRTYSPRGGAVVLPANTEEVQGVVKVCNKYKIKFKASSTFWGGMGYPSHDEAVQLDMRRMNHILEIDKKNMFAVIEPYVIGATLQAEAMKVGLNTHIIGAGGSCSPLASATSFTGAGPDSLFMDSGNSNTLGLEWVMPNGDIMRTGSLGSGLGWFCGEGPGPGVRGITRGSIGARGAMGVFTGIALKLYPWPGPTGLPITGTIPAYKAELPDNLRIYTVCFPSWQAWADAGYKIWNAGIGYIAHRQFNMFGRNLKVAMMKILTDPTKTLSDIEELLADPEIKRETEQRKLDFEIVLAGMTLRDIAWQDNALDQILAETGGWKMPDDPETKKWMLAYMIRLGHKSLNLVFGGGYDGSFCQFAPPDFQVQYESVAEFKKEWEKKGAMVEAGGDCGMGGIGGIGGGGMTGLENFVHFDPHDKASTEGTYDYFDAAADFAAKRKWPSGIERLNSLSRGADGKETPKTMRDKALSANRQAVAFRYQQKIREAFNPNDLGDAYYLTLDDQTSKG
jgi:glycolate oxidase